MGTLNLRYGTTEMDDGEDAKVLSARQFKRFRANMLGIGDISAEGDSLDALAAVFDLEGFTAFCNQVDSHLVVPEYLDKFLSWLFSSVAKEFVLADMDSSKKLLWSPLPFFAKFLGDGVLFLWRTEEMDRMEIGNTVVALMLVCSQYSTEFLPTTCEDFVCCPSKLRCGVARGKIISIGDGKDYVGPCINLASRLQKVSQLSFAFPRRGFNPKSCFGEEMAESFVTKKVRLRGFQEDELILVDKDEFEGLSAADRKDFEDP